MEEKIQLLIITVKPQYISQTIYELVIISDSYVKE